MEAPIPSEMEAPGLGLPPQKKNGGAAAARAMLFQCLPIVQ